MQASRLELPHEGRPIEDQPEGSPTYVMAKEDGQWCLVAGQNTLIADP
jgi:hypothetical protein